MLRDSYLQIHFFIWPLLRHLSLYTVPLSPLRLSQHCNMDPNTNVRTASIKRSNTVSSSSKKPVSTAPVKRNNTISVIKKTVRKFGCSRKKSSDSQTPQEPVVVRDDVNLSVFPGMALMQKETRYEMYAKHREGINQDPLIPGTIDFDASSIKHTSVNSAMFSAFSVDQWRSTPSPKPIRKNWSDLPGKIDWYTSPSGVSQRKGSISRKLSQWHGSMKRAMQASRIPRFQTVLYRPLAIQTAEARQLRVKNWTLQDRENNRWLNDGPPLSPFPGDKPATPSSSVPPPNVPTPKKASRSSIPIAIKRKPAPARTSLLTANPMSTKQPGDAPRKSEPKTPSPNPFEAEFHFYFHDQELVPAEAPRASKRMGVIFPQGGVDFRDILDEVATPSIRGDGSRYPAYKPATDPVYNSRPNPLVPTSSPPLCAAPPRQERSDPRPCCLSASETEPRAKGLVDSSTQTETPLAKQVIIPFFADLDGENFKGSASLASHNSKALQQRVDTVFLDEPIHINLHGVRIIPKSDAKEAAVAQAKSSAGKSSSRSRRSRRSKRLSATQSANAVPPVPALPPASTQRSAQAPTQHARSPGLVSSRPPTPYSSRTPPATTNFPSSPRDIPAPPVVDMRAAMHPAGAHISHPEPSQQHFRGPTADTGRRTSSRRGTTSDQRQGANTTQPRATPQHGARSQCQARHHRPGMLAREARGPMTKDEIAYEAQFRLES